MAYPSPDDEHAATPAPVLYPTLVATPGDIRSDLETHGCAYVWQDDGGNQWLVHPNQLTVYGEPKLKGEA